MAEASDADEDGDAEMGGDENDAAAGNMARSQRMAARTRRTAAAAGGDAAADGGDRTGNVDTFFDAYYTDNRPAV